MENIFNNLNSIIEKIQNSYITYNEFFKYYYFAIHDKTKDIIGLDNLKYSLINANVLYNNEKEFQSINIIKNRLSESLGISR